MKFYCFYSKKSSILKLFGGLYRPEMAKPYSKAIQKNRLGPKSYQNCLYCSDSKNWQFYCMWPYIFQNDHYSRAALESASKEALDSTINAFWMSFTFSARWLFYFLAVCWPFFQDFFGKTMCRFYRELDQCMCTT